MPRIPIVVESVLGRKGFEGIHTVPADLLFLTKANTPGNKLSPLCEQVDKALDGLLSRKIESHGLHGELGQQLLIEPNHAAYADEPVYPQRFVLLAGIGSPENFDYEVVCRVFGIMLDVAWEVGAKSVVLPFVPNRMTASKLNSQGTAHILVDRLDRKMAEHDGVCPIEKITIISTSQAKRWIEVGIKAKPAGCKDCAQS